MSEKELIEELQEIKKLLVLQLIALHVKPIEIAEILKMDKGQFSRTYPAGKLIKRMKQKVVEE